MTRRPDGDDEHPSDEDAKAARHSWIAEQLGAEWRSDGGGVYRFVGPASQPLEHESSEAPGVAEDPTDAPTWRQEQWDADEPPTTQKPRSPWLPWRTH